MASGVKGFGGFEVVGGESSKLVIDASIYSSRV
jgi:hypothetical protein